MTEFLVKSQWDSQCVDEESENLEPRWHEVILLVTNAYGYEVFVVV